MSDSQRLHASLLSVLQPELVNEDFRNVDTLAWAMTGVLLQKTICLPAWISSVPNHTDAIAREQRFRRWLQNAAIDVHQCYQPFITRALADWSAHPLYLALDTTDVANRLVIVRTAVIYRGRAVPVAWQVFKRKSVSLSFDQYASVVRYTARLLPRQANIILLADRGFRNIELMKLIRHLHWHFRVRLAENEYVWAKHRTGARLDSWVLTPYQPRFLQQVGLTAQRYGPVNLALVWDGQPTHDPWRIASDQRASLQTLADYALRMGIDSGFLDDKSAGFQLEDTELLLPGRLNHLLLVMALCNLYLVSLGTELVATGQRRLVDTHWQRGLSYLQLGWRWLDYNLANDAPLPILFRLDSEPDPEPVSVVSADQFRSS